MKSDRDAAFDEYYHYFQFNILEQIVFQNQDINAPGLLEVVHDRVQYIEDLVRNAPRGHRPSDDLRRQLSRELSLLSAIHLCHNRLEEARKTQQRQLEIFRAQNDEQSVAVVLNNLGATLMKMKKYEEARGILQESLLLKERLDGVDSKNVVSTLGILSDTQLKLGQLQEARTSAERALRIMETHFYEEVPLLYADVLSTNAQVLVSIGGEANLNRATNQVNQAIAIQIRQFGAAKKTLIDLLAAIEERQRRK
jgi:tetratricopeptide (TPR) repeat protein